MVELAAVNGAVAGSSPAPSATWVPQEERALIDKDEYHFAVEEMRRGDDTMLFVHLTVHIWTPSVFKEILRNWKLFRECVTCPVYAVGGVADTQKWERFVSRLGFKYLMDVVCENGAERRLFIHQKEQKEHERLVTTEHK